MWKMSCRDLTEKKWERSKVTGNASLRNRGKNRKFVKWQWRKNRSSISCKMSYKIDHHDGSETMAEQTIEWPFLKAQRDGGDPEVSTAAASDNESTRPSSTGPPCNNGTGSHYEIVVSNNDVPPSTTFNSSRSSSQHFFTNFPNF